MKPYVDFLDLTDYEILQSIQDAETFEAIKGVSPKHRKRFTALEDRFYLQMLNQTPKELYQQGTPYIIYMRLPGFAPIIETMQATRKNLGTILGTWVTSFRKRLVNKSGIISFRISPITKKQRYLGHLEKDESFMQNALVHISGKSNFVLNCLEILKFTDFDEPLDAIER
jgi:hypothetical protein